MPDFRKFHKSNPKFSFKSFLDAEISQPFLSSVSTGEREVCLCVWDYCRLRIVSWEKCDSPWYRPKVLNWRKKNSSNTPLTCNPNTQPHTGFPALHLLQHKSECDAGANTDTGGAGLKGCKPEFNVSLVFIFIFVV